MHEFVGGWWEMYLILLAVLHGRCGRSRVASQRGLLKAPFLTSPLRTVLTSFQVHGSPVSYFATRRFVGLPA